MYRRVLTAVAILVAVATTAVAGNVPKFDGNYHLTMVCKIENDLTECVEATDGRMLIVGDRYAHVMGKEKFGPARFVVERQDGKEGMYWMIFVETGERVAVSYTEQPQTARLVMLTRVDQIGYAVIWRKQSF